MKEKILFVFFILSLMTLAAYSQEKSEHATWFAFQPNEDFSESVIDASTWLDAPAGKHGFLQMEEGDFKFEDGTPVKFWGVNISSNRPYSDSEQVDEWVKQLSKYGVNGVRFHKFTKHAMADNQSTKLQEGKLKKFDYFHAELRKRGIYYGWSHIYGHKIKPGDQDRLLNYEEIAHLNYPWSHLNGSTSGLINFAPDLQDLSIELTINMLNHKNEITGLRYADDPALIFIELQNEDNIFWAAIEKALEQAPTYRGLLCKQFSEWLKKKYKNDEALRLAWGVENLPANESLEKNNVFPKPSHTLFSWDYQKAHEDRRSMQKHLLDKMRFLYEKQNEFYQRFVKAIRATGYKGLIVGSCWQAGTGPSHYYNLHADYQAGIIDRHNYWGGGAGHHLKKGKIKNRSMLKLPGSGLLSTGMQQVVDRPFSLSEWMPLIPNEWVAEGVPIIAMYGMGLQGWDASFHFGSDHPAYTPTLHTPGVYNVNSPTQLAFYPAIARMIYRNDIKEGTVVSTRNVHIPSLEKGILGFFEKVEQGYDNKYITGDVPAEVMAAGKVAVKFTDKLRKTPIPKIPKLWNQEEKWIRSNTQQLFWNYKEKGYYTANTPALKAVVGFASNKVHRLGEISIEIESPFAIVLATVLEKDKNFKNTKHILITTIARAVNTGMKYNEAHDALLAIGETPILLEPVDLKITLHRKEQPTVYVLDHVGRRTTQTLEVKDNMIAIEGSETKAIYYEIVYEGVD